MSDTKTRLTKDSIFIIGKVFAVEGRTIKIKVFKNKNLSHIIYNGRIVKNVSVGSYIKITKGFVNIIGRVEGEYTEEEKYYNYKYNKEESRINRVLQVSLFGHFDENGFKQGIKEMPLIDNECYILDSDEFDKLHQFYKIDNDAITIGSLSDEPSRKIKLGVNKLFASHIGIFGNTGSGKSNTLAKIYTELFRLYLRKNLFKNKSKFVVIDFNGEYSEENIITKQKYIYKLSTGKKRLGTNKYVITKDAINKLEIISILLEATEKTQIPFLSRAITNTYLDKKNYFKERVISNIENICIDIFKKQDRSVGVSYLILELFKDLSGLVEIEEGSVNPIDKLRKSVEKHFNVNTKTGDFYWGEHKSENYDKNTPIYETYFKRVIDNLNFKTDELSLLKLKIVLNYYFEILKGFSNQEHIRPLIGRMFKKFDMLGKVIEISDNLQDSNGTYNISVVSFKHVNIEMKKILPLVICKQLYDEKKENEDRNRSLHIIIDEAHNILSEMSKRESETWKDYRLETFEEIIKEGRKFGTFLTIASQRPYDISPTIISQLHNYFIHRLINNNDIIAIEKTVAYLDKLSFQTIPILPVGSCFVAGLSSDIPIKVNIDLLTPQKRPISETIDLEKTWRKDKLLDKVSQKL